MVHFCFYLKQDAFFEAYIKFLHFGKSFEQFIFDDCVTTPWYLASDMYFNPETGSDILDPIHPHPLPHQQHLVGGVIGGVGGSNQLHNLSNSSAESSTLSPMRTHEATGATISSGIGDASTASGSAHMN